MRDLFLGCPIGLLGQPVFGVRGPGRGRPRYGRHVRLTAFSYSLRGPHAEPRLELHAWPAQPIRSQGGANDSPELPERQHLLFRHPDPRRTAVDAKSVHPDAQPVPVDGPVTSVSVRTDGAAAGLLAVATSGHSSRDDIQACETGLV